MKLLVSISNYGTSQLPYLNSAIDEYLSYKKYDVTVVVDSTVPLDRDDVTVILQDPSLLHLLAHTHRQYFVDKQDDYDLFLYAENDILIKEEAIDTFLKYDQMFNYNQCLGFIRYEMRENDPKFYFPDVNSHWPCIKSKRTEVNGSDFFEFINVHQGCWILPKEKLKHVINYSDFLILGSKSIPNRIQPGLLETGASSIYRGWGSGNGIIDKFLTRNREDLKRCLIHHMSNKYCRLDDPVWQNDPGPTTFESLTEWVGM